jgi:glycosyltransferase involved in cell wall biosynthesis
MSTPYAVTVPYYANPGYLRLTLDSVVAQTDGDWRCVVVDDSPDDSARERRGGRRRPPVRLERNPVDPRRGRQLRPLPRAGRSTGPSSCVILHADDLLEPRYVAADARRARAAPRRRLCGPARRR